MTRVAASVLALAAVSVGCGEDGGAPAPSAAVTARIPVRPPPGALAVGEGAVWVTASTTFRLPLDERSRHAVVRIDPGRDEVTATIQTPNQLVDLAVGEGAVWVVGTEFRDDGSEPVGRILRIDPRTDEVTHTVELGGSSLSAVAVGHRSVWVTDSRRDRLLRLDPTRVEVVDAIPVSGGPTSVAVDGQGVWVARPGEGAVSRVNPRTGVPEERVEVEGLPSVVTVGPSGVWVADYLGEEVVRIDPARLEVDERTGFESSPSRLALQGNRLVVAEAEARRISVVDVESGAASALLSGPFVVDVALDGSTLWAVDHEDDTVIRIRLG